MQPKEGGPLGSLSDYVSERIADIAAQKAEEQRQAAEAEDRMREARIQRTVPLRAHLLELVKPLDELLARFRVKELLEEAQTQFLQGGVIRKLEPRIYQSIVSQPDVSITNFELSRTYPSRDLWNESLSTQGMSRIYLTSLLGLNNLIPDLAEYRMHMLDGWWGRIPSRMYDRYGLALELSEKREREVNGRVLRSGTTRSYRNSTPGRCGGWEVSYHEDFWTETDNHKYRVYETRAMVVGALRTELLECPYDLVYNFMGEYDHPDSKEIVTQYLTPPRIVNSQEALKQMIANDIVKELTSSVDNH